MILLFMSQVHAVISANPRDNSLWDRFISLNILEKIDKLLNIIHEHPRRECDLVNKYVHIEESSVSLNYTAIYLGIQIIHAFMLYFRGFKLKMTAIIYIIIPILLNADMQGYVSSLDKFIESIIGGPSGDGIRSSIFFKAKALIVIFIFTLVILVYWHKYIYYLFNILTLFIPRSIIMEKFDIKSNNYMRIGSIFFTFGIFIILYKLFKLSTDIIFAVMTSYISSSILLYIMPILFNTSSYINIYDLSRKDIFVLLLVGTAGFIIQLYSIRYTQKKALSGLYNFNRK